MIDFKYSFMLCYSYPCGLPVYRIKYVRLGDREELLLPGDAEVISIVRI